MAYLQRIETYFLDGDSTECGDHDSGLGNYKGYAVSCAPAAIRRRRDRNQPRASAGDVASFLMRGERAPAERLSFELLSTNGNARRTKRPAAQPLRVIADGAQRPLSDSRPNGRPAETAAPFDARTAFDEKLGGLSTYEEESFQSRDLHDKSKFSLFAVAQNRILVHDKHDTGRPGRTGREVVSLVSEAEDEIARRIDEINEMRKRRCDIASIIPELTPQQLYYVENLSNITAKEFRQLRRRNWKLKDYFRNAARVAILIVKGFNATRRRYHRFDTKGSRIQRSQRRSNAFFVTQGTRNQANIVPGMMLEMRLALSSQPWCRNTEEVTKILWMARAMNAFQKMFAEDMEMEMARRVAYDKFDDKRLVAYQNRQTEKIYFVLSGKMTMLTEYELHTGIVTRFIGELTSGMHTDPDALEQGHLRSCHLVANGFVELMSLDKKDFLYLTKYNEGLPMTFIKELELFHEFPLERFEGSHDAVTMKYQRPGKIICKDSNRTQWIFIVRSGKVKVIRRQPVLQSQHGTAGLKAAIKKDDSHAHAMLGFLSTQRKLKQFFNDGHSPLSLSSTTSSLPLSESVTSSSLKLLADRSQFGRISSPSAESDQAGKVTEGLFLPAINVPTQGAHMDRLTSKYKSATAAPIPLSIPSLAKKEAVSIRTRDSYVQLDVLVKGSVFGLDHLHEAKFSEGIGLTLLSDGAEVLAVSKRFFLQNATNNTMLKVETMFKEYMSTADAQQSLREDETWSRYRNVVLEKAVTAITSQHLKQTAQ